MPLFLVSHQSHQLLGNFPAGGGALVPESHGPVQQSHDYCTVRLPQLGPPFAFGRQLDITSHRPRPALFFP